MEWPIASPGDVGFDADALEAGLRFAEERNSAGVVIARGGAIVAERYWSPGAVDRASSLFSAGKPIVSTLVGMAIDDGAIDSLDQPAADFLTEWKDDARSAITLRHLMSMTSGLRCTFDIDFRKLPQADDEERLGLSLPLDYQPGTCWQYNNAAYRMLYSIIGRAVGVPVTAFARTRLFDPLGMERTFWKIRNTAGAENPQTIWSTCREAARFGQLVIDRGVGGGRRLVSEAFLDEATRPSQPHNPAYGLLWWLNGESRYIVPSYRRLPDVHEGWLLPGYPADGIAALGVSDQKIYVIPSLEMVIVRLGEGASTGRPLAAGSFDVPFLSAVLAAVR